MADPHWVDSGSCLRNYFFYKNNTAITTMQNIGTMFINLIQMIVLPIVVSCLTVGIASMGDIKKNLVELV